MVVVCRRLQLVQHIDTAPEPTTSDLEQQVQWNMGFQRYERISETVSETMMTVAQHTKCEKLA